MKTLYWLAAVLMAGTYICGPVHDVDLWWHIVAGRWIIAQKTIPVYDFINAFAEGKPWVAYSWSFEIIVAFLDSTFGDQGLYAAKIALGITLALSLSLFFVYLSGDRVFGLLLGIYACTTCHNHFVLRPQSVIWVLFALIVWIAEDIHRNGLSGRNRLLLVAIMCLWSNVHLTQAFGLLTVFLWIIDRNNWQVALEATLYAFLGSLITPYGGYEWVVFLSKSGHPAMFSAIAEFKPATLLQYHSVFILLISIVTLLFIHKRPEKLRYGQYAFAGIFLLGGAAVVKFIPFAAIAICALLASLWSVEKRSEAFGNLGEAIERLCSFLKNAPIEGATFLILVLAFLNVYPVWRQPVAPQRTPVNALNFIQREKLPEPLLHDFGRGGYVSYRFADEFGVLSTPVPIDGRTNVNPPEVWILSRKALMGQSGWDRYFDVVQPGSVLWRTQSPLISILMQQDKWCRVFQTGSEEEGYSVFISKREFRRRKGQLQSENCQLKDIASS